MMVRHAPSISNRAIALLGAVTLCGCQLDSGNQTPAPGELTELEAEHEAWPTKKIDTAPGCFLEEAGLAPEKAECHPYLGPWNACNAPDSTKDIYETCNGNVLTETNPDTPNTRHDHPGGKGHPYLINCQTYCDHEYGWDGCDWVGECKTEQIQCGGGNVDAGYCTCDRQYPCDLICCVVGDYWNEMTAEACEEFGGENLGATEDCFGPNKGRPPGPFPAPEN